MLAARLMLLFDTNPSEHCFYWDLLWMIQLLNPAAQTFIHIDFYSHARLTFYYNIRFNWKSRDTKGWVSALDFNWLIRSNGVFSPGTCTCDRIWASGCKTLLMTWCLWFRESEITDFDGFCVFPDQSGIPDPFTLWVSDVGHSAHHWQAALPWKCYPGQVRGRGRSSSCISRAASAGPPALWGVTMWHVWSDRQTSQ